MCNGHNWRGFTFNTHHSTKGDGSGGMVVDGYEVDEEGCPTHHGWDQEGSNKHLFNPSPSYTMTLIYKVLGPLNWV